MKLQRCLSALATLAFFGAGSGAAFAASQQPPQPSGLTALHDALHLTPVQENAWRAYQAAVAPDPSAEARHQAAVAMMASLPTPRRVDLIDAELQDNLQMIVNQGDALKAFYAALSPSQQKTFDQETLKGDPDQSGSSDGTDRQGLRQPPAGAPGGPQP